MTLSKPGFPLLITFITTLAIAACQKDDGLTIEQLDEQNIEAYIQRNNLHVQEYVDENGVRSGIYYEILAEGTGHDIDYAKQIPLVFTQKSLDGKFQELDTFSSDNRYMDYFGYFPFGSSYAGVPGSPVEKEESIKMVIKKTLLKTDGKIRVIVPSRQLYGRNGVKNRGIPPNASIDYEIHVIDSVARYEDQNIQDFLQKNGLSDFTKTESGIYYKITETGTGSPITVDSTVKCDYTGRFLNGSTFDSGTDASFTIANNINAWKEIIPLLKEGGKVRLISPSAQAYGPAGSRDPNTGTYVIPQFSSLDFDVTIKEVSQP